MPTVVTFWRLPEEESAFLEYLNASGEIVAVSKRNSESREALEPRPVRQVIQDDPAAMFLLRSEHIGLLRVVPFQRDGATWYGIHAMKSPVIDYIRGKWRSANRLSQSNIACYSDYPDEEGKTMIEHPKEFVDWSRGVSKWVRKSTPFSYQYKNYRITTLVNERLKAGLELVP